MDSAQSLSAFFYMCMGDPMSCWNTENKYLVFKYISCHIIGEKKENNKKVYIYIYMYIYQLIYLVCLAKEEKLKGKELH